MRPKTRMLWLVFVAVSLAVAPLLAADDPIAEETSGEVAWRTGGVGTDERSFLERVSGQYNLKLIFAEKDTLAFVADVVVRIAPAGGEPVLEAKADGPWFFVRLPAGKYEVTATGNGVPQTQTTEVPASGQAELRYYWAPAATGKGSAS